MTPAGAQNILETEKSMYLEIYLAEFDTLSNRLTYLANFAVCSVWLNGCRSFPSSRLKVRACCVRK
jgi:hypothetical protein